MVFDQDLFIASAKERLLTKEDVEQLSMYVAEHREDRRYGLEQPLVKFISTFTIAVHGTKFEAKNHKLINDTIMPTIVEIFNRDR